MKFLETIGVTFSFETPKVLLNGLTNTRPLSAI
jgi:hypothetical protein